MLLLQSIHTLHFSCPTHSCTHCFIPFLMSRLSSSLPLTPRQLTHSHLLSLFCSCSLSNSRTCWISAAGLRICGPVVPELLPTFQLFPFSLSLPSIALFPLNGCVVGGRFFCPVMFDWFGQSLWYISSLRLLSSWSRNVDSVICGVAVVKKMLTCSVVSLVCPFASLFRHSHAFSAFWRCTRTPLFIAKISLVISARLKTSVIRSLGADAVAAVS